MLSSPSTQLLTADIESFTTDYTHSYHTDNCPAVVVPSSVEELQAVLRYCYDQHIPVVPQGGNTGLVGGSIPVFDELIISTRKLNHILDFNEETGVLRCESGCVLELAQEFVSAKGHVFPLDLGSKGSCTVGGNVSTNAGGSMLCRYGALSSNVVGLEAVLPDGTLFNSMSSWRKDNTGLKLHQLFVGSEGILGMLTKLAIFCPVQSQASHVCLFQCSSFDNVVKTALECRRQLNEIVVAIEFFDAQSLSSVLSEIPNTRKPFPVDSNFYVLVETLGTNSDQDGVRVESVVESLLEKELVKDGVLAENDTQRADLWKLRENINPAFGEQGKVFKYDVTLPLGKMYSVVDIIRDRFKDKGITPEDCDTAGYGHLADGNIHVNVLLKNTDKDMVVNEALEPWVYEYVLSLGGSISAEHGMGLQKVSKMGMCKDKNYIKLMGKVKHVFDDRGIMNPYKMFIE